MQEAVRQLFPENVQVVSTTRAIRPERLYRAEREIVRGAVDKRRREFAMGRWCARRALERLGIRNFPVLRAVDRAPLWPTGVVGSLSHTGGVAAAAVAREECYAGLGLDVESGEALAGKLFRHICTEAEIEALRGLDPHEAGARVKRIFSAKESVYKCIHPTVRRFVGFRSCTIELGPDEATFSARFIEAEVERRLDGRTVRGRLGRWGGLVLSGAMLLTQE